ncbi:MAG: hypothetical protein JXR86_05530 [Spirochaetales bacterium]|nr:hypothetical protein [Spirochaetales bacterium]
MDSGIVFKLILPFLFALILLPLIVRFVIGKIVFRRIRSRELQKLRSGFSLSDSESDAFVAFESFLRDKIRTPFVSTNVIGDDFRAILLMARKAFVDDGEKTIKYSFSVSDLIKCFFLLMNDLEELWRGNRGIERLSGTRISTFLRINRISGYYGTIYRKIPFLKFLRKGRVTGKVIRLLFIPLIGLPSLFISIGASFLSLFLTEIIWRHYYSLLLIRSFSYIMILYGGRNSLIEKKLDQFSKERIRSEASKIEDLLDPAKGIYRSDVFEKSYLIYQRYLEEYGVSPEKDLDFNGIEYRFNRKRDFIRRIFQVPVRTANQYNPMASNGVSHKEQLLRMIGAIAEPYSGRKNFYSDLRVVDLFDSLYMISLLAYSRILFGSFLLNSVSLDFLINAKNLSDELAGEWLSRRFPRFRESYRTFKLFRKSRILYKAVRRGNPVGLIFSLSGPLAVESARTVIRDYIYRRAGRLTLYCYDSNRLKKKRLFEFKVIKKSEVSPEP